MHRAGKTQVVYKLLSLYVLLSLVFSLLGGFISPQAAYAKREVPKPPVVVHHDETGKVSFLGTGGGKPISVPGADRTGMRPVDRARVILETYGPWFGVQNSRKELFLKSERSAGQNHKVMRYQQKFEGIPVMGGEVIVNMTAQGQMISMNGEVSPELDLSVTPTITSMAARAIAVAKVAKVYHLSHSALRGTEPELWIFDERLLRPSTKPAELVWRVEVRATNGAPINELVLINAERGGISLHFNQVDTQWDFGEMQGNLSSATDTPTATPAPIPQQPGNTIDPELYFDLVVDDSRGLLYGSDRVNGRIHIISQSTLDVIDYVDVGLSPKGIDISPDGSELAVAVSGQAEVAFIDLNTLTVTDRVVPDPTPINYPEDVVYGRLGRLYVGNDGYIHVIDTVTKTEVGKSLKHIFSSPRLAITSDNNTLFARSNRFDITTDIPNSTGAAYSAFQGNTIAINGGDNQIFTSWGQAWSSDLTTHLGNFAAHGNEVEYIPTKDWIAISYESEIYINDASNYLYPALTTYPLSGTAGPARVNSTDTILYVSTSNGIEAITLPASITPTIPPVDPQPDLYYDMVVDDARGLIYGSVLSGGSSDRDEIDVVDMTTLEVIDTIDLGGYEYINPQGLDISPDGNTLAVALSGGAKIGLIDLNTWDFAGFMFPGQSPDDVVFGRTGRLYTNCSTNGQHDYLCVFDTTSYLEVGRTSTTEPSFHRLAITADNNTLYAARIGGSPAIYRFDITTDTPIRTIQCSFVTLRVNAIALNEDESQIFTSKGQAWSSDLLTHLGNFAAEGDDVEYIPTKDWIAISYGSEIYINDASDYLYPLLTIYPLSGTVGPARVNSTDTILYVSTSNGMEAITLPPSITPTIPPVDPQPDIYYDMVVDDARGVIYGSVRDGDRDEIDVISMSTLEVIDSIDLGGYEKVNPQGLDISPDGNFLAVALTFSTKIALIDLNTLDFAGFIFPGEYPDDVVFGRTGRLYTSCSTSGQHDYICVFDTASYLEVGRTPSAIYTVDRLAITTDNNTLYVSKNSGSPDDLNRFDITTDIPGVTGSPPPLIWVSTDTIAIDPLGTKVYTSRGQIWSGDLSTQLGSFTDTGDEIEYIDTLDVFAVSNGSQITFYDGSDYSLILRYPLGGTAGVARVNGNDTILYVNTSAGIEAIDLTLALTANTWYVSTTGDDVLNDCLTPSTPCETINGALGKGSGGDLVYVSEGTYTGTGSEVVLVDKDITLSGGWDASFSSQVGMSIIDGGGARRGVTIASGITVDMDYFTVQNGYAMMGGGIFSEGNLTLNDCVVRGNVAEGSTRKGGGIYNSGTLFIHRCEITENRLVFGGEGGGIYNSDVLTINESSIHHNHAPHTGGGIYSNNGTVTITNTTISHNTTDYLPGGGISADYTTITINNGTIAYNSAAKISGDYAGGGVSFNYCSVTLYNTIIAENESQEEAFASPDCRQNNIGDIVSGGYNLIGENCNITPTTGDIFGINPKLIPGLVGFPGVHALYSDSPAIDAGDPATPGTCEVVDQRGIARPIDGEPNGSSLCDIGAFEYNPSPGAAAAIYMADGSPQHSPPGETFTQPLLAVVTDGVGNPVSGVTVTFTAPASGASGTFAGSGTNVTTAVTDANGIATSAVFTANSQEGSYFVVASAAGVSGSASFDLANLYWYVSTTGNNANDCLSPATACQSFHGVIDKFDFLSGDIIKSATGNYSWVDTPGVNPNYVIYPATKDVVLLGGWDNSFTSQVGMTFVDGRGEDIGLGVKENVTAVVERFDFHNAPLGVANWGTLELKDCVMGDNEKGIASSGMLTVLSSTIANNIQHNDYGAGIINNSGNLEVKNSTISGNVAYSGGAGIYNNNNGDVYLYNTTIVDNLVTSGVEGAGIWNDTGSVSIQNSILARNYIGGTGTWGDCHGSITSSGYNLLGVDTDCTFSSSTGDLVGTGASPIDPLLCLLQDNGGLTHTNALFEGSPAINAGSPDMPGNEGNACELVDQRGITRPVDGRCDIGAFEGSIPLSYFPWLMTYTANNVTTLPGELLCTQAQPNCTNGDDPHADAAHQYAHDTFNFYSDNHDRDSIDNAGMTLISSVHYDSGYNNAYWSGSLDQIVYGDGNGYPLADDVVAHEYTHGVTDYASGLFYYYQSGAIDEAFSDLWGEFVDLTNGAGDDSSGVRWKIGEDITGLGAIRDMEDPPYFSDPDKMTSTFYYTGDGDNGGVHTNNGVNNKAVYLMVDGGSHNGYSVTGMGIPKVAALYYEAQTNLLTSGADYKDLYYALQQACANLLWGAAGITAADCLEVKKALDAVEMNYEPDLGYNPDAAFCPAGKGPSDIFYDGFEIDMSNWVATDGGSPDPIWNWAIGYAHGGTKSLYGIDYQGYDTYAALSSDVSLPPGVGTYLHFSHSFGFEDPNYDGGWLEYSTNEGGSWLDAIDLFVDGLGYTVDDTISSDYNNPNPGHPAFIGDSHGYVSSKYDLSSYAGQNIRFRWRISTDSTVRDFGWVLDDVRIYKCEDPTFGDVPFDHPFYDYIMALWDNELTAGCSTNPLMYCPDQILNRAMTAVFMLRGEFGTYYTPPDPPWDSFNDDWVSLLPPDYYDVSWSETWAEGMLEKDMTAGCQYPSTAPLLYCPRRQLPRVEAAVFGLNMKFGVDYEVPPALGTVFADMTDVGYWGTPWAEQAYLNGILPACGWDSGSGKPLFCPDDLVSRAWAAYLIVQAKNLLP